MTVAAIEYFVGGIPKPQGSRTAMRSKSTGKIITRESSDTLAAWRNDVADATARRMSQDGVYHPYEGLVAMEVRFYFRAPQVLTRQYRSTFAKGGDTAVKKRWSQIWCEDDQSLYKAYGDDLDKLVRAVADALVAGGAIVDDRQVAWLKSGKFFALHEGQRSRSGANIALMIRPPG